VTILSLSWLANVTKRFWASKCDCLQEKSSETTWQTYTNCSCSSTSFISSVCCRHGHQRKRFVLFRTSLHIINCFKEIVLWRLERRCLMSWAGTAKVNHLNYILSAWSFKLIVTWFILPGMLSAEEAITADGAQQEVKSEAATPDPQPLSKWRVPMHL